MFSLIYPTTTEYEELNFAMANAPMFSMATYLPYSWGHLIAFSNYERLFFAMLMCKMSPLNCLLAFLHLAAFVGSSPICICKSFLFSVQLQGLQGEKLRFISEEGSSTPYQLAAWIFRSRNINTWSNEGCGNIWKKGQCMSDYFPTLSMK